MRPGWWSAEIELKSEASTRALRSSILLKELGLGLGLRLGEDVPPLATKRPGLGLGIGIGRGRGFPLGNEGAAQREQLEADDAERPHVGRAAVGLAVEQLGCHVVGRAHEGGRELLEGDMGEIQGRYGGDMG